MRGEIYEPFKKEKRILKFILAGLFSFMLGGAYNEFCSSREKPAINSSQYIQKDSLYQHKKDSLTDNYVLELNKIEEDYQNKLNKLEKELNENQ